jgi:hypothetical protein
MIVAVSGWRDWDDPIFVIGHLHRYRRDFGGALHVRVGCAAGVDKVVRDWLRVQQDMYRRPVSHTVYYADWANLGRAAGPIRNGQMLRGEGSGDEVFPNVLADVLLAFPQPGVKMRSPGSGTAGCVLEAHQIGISLDVPGYRGPDTRIEERR